MHEKSENLFYFMLKLSPKSKTKTLFNNILSKRTYVNTGFFSTLIEFFF